MYLWCSRTFLETFPGLISEERTPLNLFRECEDNRQPRTRRARAHVLGAQFARAGVPEREGARHGARREFLGIRIGSLDRRLRPLWLVRRHALELGAGSGDPIYPRRRDARDPGRWTNA